MQKLLHVVKRQGAVELSKEEGGGWSQGADTYTGDVDVLKDYIVGAPQSHSCMWGVLHSSRDLGVRLTQLL